MKSVSFLNPLGFYNFCEEREFNPIKFGVNVSEDDKIISVTEDGSLLGVVKLSLKSNELSLIGKDGNIFSSVELPIVDVVENAYYDEDRCALIIEVTLSDGTKKEIVVPFNDLLDDYAKVEDVEKNAQDIAQVNANLVEAIAEINKNMSEGFDTLNTAIHENQIKIAELNAKCDNISSGLESEIANREAGDKALLNEISIVNKNLVEAIDNYNNVVLPRIISDLNNSIQAERDARIEDDNKLDAKINSVDEHVNQVNERLTQVNDELTNSINKLDNDLKQAVDEIYAVNQEQNNRITALESKIQDGCVTPEELKKAIEEEMNRAIAAEDYLKSLIDATNQELKNINNSLSIRIDSLEQRMNEMESSSSSVNEKITVIENEINIIQSDITSINERIDNLERVINETISNLDNKFSEAISDLQSKLEEEISTRDSEDDAIRLELSNKVDWTTIGEKTRDVRKAIVLENHDALMGKGTDGTVYNLSMVSKWNKADFGSSSILLNLNGKGEHPTYNDKFELAFVDDIEASVGSIKLVKDNDNQYTLYVNEQACGTIVIPVDKFIKSVTFVSETKELVFVFITEQGEQTVRVDMSELVDTYTAGVGLELVNNSSFVVKIDSTSEGFLTVSNNGLKLSGVQEAIDSKISEAIKDSEDKTDELLANKVDWTDISNESNPNRKSIVFKNHDCILGTTTKGGTANVAMINKWDIVDLGTSSLPINLNTPKGIRPTVQEAGQSGEEANQIAYVSDVEAEKSRAEKIENMIIGQESDDKDDLSLYGVKAYADYKTSQYNDTIDKKIQDAVDPINAKFDLYMSLEDASQFHDDLLAEAKAYSDEKDSLVSAATVNESVSKSNQYTDEKLQSTNAQLAEHADRITAVEGQCEHFDTLFGMILEEHDSGQIEVNFYTKAETDEKIAGAVEAEKNRAEGVENELKSELDKTVKYTDASSEQNPNRKIILLENHDSLMGKSVNGGAYNIAMVSKWDKADFGSTSLELNLNGKAEHPTYNDSKEIAFLDDIKSSMDNISLQKISDLEYALMVGDKNVGTINIPKDQFLKSVTYDNETKEMSFVFETTEGESTIKVDISNLVDVYNAGNGLSLSDNTFSLNIDVNTQKYIEVSENGIKIVNVDEELAKKVDWTDISTEDNPNRKSIVLNNHDTILGTDTSGNTKSILMINKWDIVDLGTTTLPINLNTPKDVRPTVQEAGQTGEEAHKIAYMSDVEASNSKIDEHITESDAKFEEVNLSIETEKSRAEGVENDLKAELDKAVKYDSIPTSELPERKAITLKNHDCILGASTSGETYNIAMVSKWDKVDLGSASLELNLNGKADHPTYNDSKEIAFIEDIDASMDTILLQKNSDLEYSLLVGDKIAGTINIPKDQFLKNVSYDEDSKTIKFIFETSEGESNVDVNISNLVDVYTAGNGLSLSSNQFYLNIDTTTQKYIEVSENGLKIVNIDEAFDKKVDWTDISVEGMDDRKAIVLKNHDMILGTDTNGSTSNLIMLNKWDVVDLGSNKLPINMNVPSGVRPTVQEAGQTGEEANKIAYVSDVEEAKSETNEVLAKKVDWVDISTEDNIDRKAIVLKNHDTILGSDTSGKTISLLMVNKWDVVDLGTTTLPINLNTPKGIRPTVQEAGQSGEEANKIAYVSDIENLKGYIDDKLSSMSDSITLLNDALNMLQNKYDSMVESSSEQVSSYDGTQELNDASKSYLINGDIINNSTILAKSAIFNDSTLSNNARINVKADNVEFNSFNVSGDFPRTNGNAVISINEAEYITFKNMTFDSSNIYNGIEIGLSSKSKLPKNILFENCKFTGSFSNNAILIFGTQDDAVITLSNCTFEKVSNALRLSNKSNAKNITVNIINCNVGQWDTTAPWQGFLICQDYTSKSSEEVDSNNLFGNGKINVNFSNLVYKDKKVIVDDLATVCGTADENQIIYLYAQIKDESHALPYSESTYPNIIFK